MNPAKTTRFLLGSVVAALCSLAPVAPPVFAQSYPAKPVRIVVPFAPGGGSDFIARFMAQRLTEAWGKQVIVENKPGAGGVLGIESGIKSAPDGYTLTLIASSYTVNPSIYKLNFDPVADITPIIQMSQGPLLIVARPSLPVKSTQDLIALAKSKPGQVNFASSGQGSVIHLATELFGSMAGIKMNHIPYKGTGPALTDLLGGHIPMAFAPIPASHPNVSAGKLRALAVTSVTRSGLLPDVPTMIEAGLSGFDASLYYGLVAPAGTPRPIIDKLNKALRDALASDEVKKQLGNDGTEITPGTPEDYANFIDKDEKKWSQLVKASGVEQE